MNGGLWVHIYSYDDSGGSGGGGSPLVVAQEAITSASAAPLIGTADLQPIVDEAIARWASFGISASSVDRLRQTRLVVADLPGSYLGLAQRDAIYIDSDAAGRGWFVDPTPWDD